MRYFCLFILLFIGCKSSESKLVELETKSQITDTIHDKIPTEKFFPAPDYNQQEWTEFIHDTLFSLDIRYATTKNFMKQQIYDCPRCFLRPLVAKQFLLASQELYRKGYKVILFDCYRPRPYQQKLWDIMPNAMYVTPPKKGSMHNRGHAIDIGLIDRKSNDTIDFGTDYDYFGQEAHFAYNELPAKTKKSRILLRKTLEKYGFTGIRTEWWHFSYKKELESFSDWLWKCD